MGSGDSIFGCDTFDTQGTACPSSSSGPSQTPVCRWGGRRGAEADGPGAIAAQKHAGGRGGNSEFH